MIYEIIGFTLVGILPAAFFGWIILDSILEFDFINFISWMFGYLFFASMAGLGIYFISLAQ